ncbi:hydrolase [Leifsonia sp. Root1293]|nr:hydrolase [Leifsonia sp. Root1293]KRA09430.1 hydrolase [Leifsonia sp. Root60]
MGHRLRVIAGWIVGVLLLIVVLFAVYTQIVMQGERPAAIDAWSDEGVSITSTDHSIVMTPTGEASGDGLVFVPGAKVDPYAYMNKLSGIVADGTTVVITKPTLNLAFFDTRPLSAFTADAPDVSTWYVGGHSLGGVRACMLADDPDVSGIILFGSYCANDLSETSLAVLSLGGQNDGLSTPEKIADSAALLPSDATFVEIAGANHASFGDYGVQPGDGEATATSDEVREEITAQVDAFLGEVR